MLRNFDADGYIQNTDAKVRAASLVNRLKGVGRVDVDVFSVDNTNVIEGYFNGVKGRMRTSLLTLLDVFNAVDTTEGPSLRPDRRSRQNSLPVSVSASSASSRAMY